MKLSDYDMVYGLFVDYRFEADCKRVGTILAEKGVTHFSLFIDGKGHELERFRYNQISPNPVNGWQDGPASYSQFCAIKKIITNAKTCGYETILFVEDDLIFTDDFDEILNKAGAELPDDWEMFYYGANHTGHKTNHISPHILRVFGSACTHCVAIRSTIFDDILALPPDRTMDWNIANRLHPTHKCYAAWPSIAVQRPGYSYLWKQDVDYSSLWANKGTQV